MKVSPLAVSNRNRRMKNWTVYKHVAPNGKVYVGISSDIKRRWAANGYYYRLTDTVFSRALNKYGWNCFQHVIVQEGLTKKEACAMEKTLIAYYKEKRLSYNITDGGEGYCGKHSEEHNKHKVEARISNNTVEYLVIDKTFNYTVFQTEKEAAEYLGGTQRGIATLLTRPIGYTYRKHYIWKHPKGTPVYIEDIKKQIQEALSIRYKKASETIRQNSSKLIDASRKAISCMTMEEKKKKFGRGDRLRGRHHMDTSKKKISEAAKGRDMSRAHAAAMKVVTIPVLQIQNGQVISSFNSIREASHYTHINESNIAGCIRKERKTAGGYNWEKQEERRGIYVA